MLAALLSFVSFLSKNACILGGFLYPAWCSYKVLEGANDSSKEIKQWLIYWVVFVCLFTVEDFCGGLVGYIPLYFLLKLGFVIWLLSPGTQGATVLYRKYIGPLIQRHEAKIEQAIVDGRRQVMIAIGEQNFASIEQMRRRIFARDATAPGPAPAAERPARVADAAELEKGS